MPIHTSWKSMAKGMRSTYAGQGKTKCYSFTDGTSLCMSMKAWSVFHAKINKMGADETKPRLKKKKISEARERLIEWFMESTLKGSDIPRWVGMAVKVLGSDKYNDKTKTYWRGRLQKWCKANPKNKICKKIKVNESLLTEEVLRKITEKLLETRGK